MHAIDRQFTQIINGNTQFVIPVFQRDYSWTQVQCEQMWADILNAAGTTEGPGHFLGSFVYMATDDNTAGFTRWLIVDGQQRLTTLMILLIALRDYMEETNYPETDEGPTPARIDGYFLNNIHESGSRKQKLILRRNDAAILTGLLNKKHPGENVSHKIIENYDYFKSRLKDSDVEMVYSGVNRLVVVDVALDRKTDNPQLVFESLNSTGLDLTSADLVRNFVLLSIEEKEQTRLYEEYWSPLEQCFAANVYAIDNFIRDYVAARTGATRQSRAKDIYYEFRDAFNRFTEIDGDIETTLTDMLSKAGAYSAFIAGNSPDADLAISLFRLRRLTEVPAILIMRLHHLYTDSDSLSKAEFIEALGLIESYVLRRAVCRIQSRNFWSYFAAMSKRIGDSNPLLDLKVALARLTESYRFPSDEEFATALKTVDLYDLRVCKVVLDGLENYGNNEPSDTSMYSIEHILPQNLNLPAGWREMLGVDWEEIQSTRLHRLGNLTLTGYNSTYSDKPFDEKKVIDGGFNQSSVRLNQFVREQLVWTDQEIDTRTTALADRSLVIWQGLKVAPAAIRDAELHELKLRSEAGDTKRVPMTAASRSLYEKLASRLHSEIPELIELAEPKSVSYFAPNFFMELVPRKYSVQLILSQKYSEIQDPKQYLEDATTYTFVVNSSQFSPHQSGVLVALDSEDMIDSVMPFIHQSVEAARTAE